MIARDRPESELLRSPLLVTESKDAFDQIRDAFTEEIKPRGIVERMYVTDITYLTWDILRYRRCKAAIVNSRLRDALQNLLQALLREPGQYAHHRRDEAADLAHAWFSDQKTRKRVLELLRQFHLDESAIEAEAMRESVAALDQLDRLLASLESRRNKALRCIAEYRGGFARQLRDSSDRIIEGKVLALDSPAIKSPPAAA